MIAGSDTYGCSYRDPRGVNGNSRDREERAVFNLVGQRLVSAQDSGLLCRGDLRELEKLDTDRHAIG